MGSGNTGGNVQYLYTGEFSDAIDAFKEGIKEYNRIRTDVERTTNTLFTNWSGKGKTQFEKDYRIIYQQLEDIEDIMYELYNALIEAEATYIKADEATAKALTL